MIRSTLLLLLALSPCLLAQAGVYRWVDAEGRVHFSDRPGADVQALDLGVARSVATDPADNAPAPAAPAFPFTGPYSRFEIRSPAADARLERARAGLAVVLELEPGLAPGHRLVMVLDGLETVIEAGATRFALEGVSFGAHRLEVLIRDAEGALVARTPTHAFMLQRQVPPGEL
ncbi:DUF4124 domain-containing protein [Marichromatium bheemlicum]|uniref:DUF4124 domain-containing protein n=1 Tax=Marichromatium bheemlicum TaxID=365339 RepID=A0ABX1I6F6_9GAMM|nr:DUF4124 domain-containing protein [Marichromatium bheemlicum]NKN32639.1 DUF4124 domain-containing protein [Marichromatium bheemlicum]